MKSAAGAFGAIDLPVSIIVIRFNLSGGVTTLDVGRDTQH